MVLCHPVRTAIGAYNGSLKGVTAPDLGAFAVRETGVRVNAVAPGPTETGMLNRFTRTAERKAALASGGPLGRIGEPAEIARAIVFMATE